jgi:hypothetical protein
MVSAWCEELLRARPSRRLFETGHLSAVIGLELDDGREVVVKARPVTERLEACARVHTHLWHTGYPCPEPLAGPVVRDGLAVSAEAYVPAGEPPARADTPAIWAPPLARLVALAPPPASLPSLAPSPAWVAWQGETGALWPPPDDRDEDLNQRHEPAWIDEAGDRARRRLSETDLPVVVGHVDFWWPNLIWNEGVLLAVLDWDSVAALPEAALVGVAATSFPPTPATVAESSAFLAAYQRARGRFFGAEELEVSWAAGVWSKTFDAKKESVDGPGPTQTHVADEVEERLSLAGA